MFGVGRANGPLEEIKVGNHSNVSVECWMNIHDEMQHLRLTYLDQEDRYRKQNKSLAQINLIIFIYGLLPDLDHST